MWFALLSTIEQNYILLIARVTAPLGHQPRIENLFRHGLRREPQAHDEDVRMIPPPGAASCFGFSAQGRSNATNLVRRDRRPRARPAEQNALIGTT